MSENFVRNNPIGDYRLPVKGLVAGRATETAIQRTIGDLLVEELRHEFRCVRVDLIKRREVMHRSGRIADAVACSLRLPGLYPPYEYGGTLHVDGGVMDNLPVSALSRRRGADRRRQHQLRTQLGSRSWRSPAQRGSARPPIGETLTRTMMMASGDASERAMQQADLVLRPAAAGAGLLELHQIDRMREAGREAVRASLPQLHELAGR